MKKVKCRSVLCALLALCLLFTLTACGGSGEVKEPEVKADGSADSNIYKSYQIGIDELMQQGADYAELGLTYLSGYGYSTALSAASCLQMTACALLGDTSTLACPDWYAAAAITRAAPYPVFFQGLLCEFKGDEIGSAEFYRQAELYYEFPQILYAFRYLKDASARELESVKGYCEEKIATITAVYTPTPYDLPLGELDFMAGYHQARGDCYAEEENYAEALRCYDMALRMNPYETGNYVACASMALYAGDPSVAQYLSEGLTLDPGDAGLNLLSAMTFESHGEAETALYYLDIAQQDDAMTAEQKTIADSMEARIGGGGQ